MQGEVQHSVKIRVVPLSIGIGIGGLKQIKLLLEHVAGCFEGGRKIPEVYWSDDVDKSRVRDHFPEVLKDGEVGVGRLVMHCS